jgi:hypothetical protein
MPRKPFGPFLATLLSLALLHGCSGGSGPGSPGGAGGTGAVTGGQGGGSPTGGKGGSAGSGGAAGGSGGATGGSGGTGGSLPDGGPPTGDPMAVLDACFAGLRTLAMINQIATKRSADGKYAVRIALEYPPGSVGTSGTFPWAAIRFAIVTPQGQLCIKDEGMLRAPYRGSLHNCNDVFTVTSNGITYQLKYPDTTPERPDTVLTITGGTTVPPVTLATVSCKSQSGGQCLSGGPCN